MTDFVVLGHNTFSIFIILVLYSIPAVLFQYVCLHYHIQAHLNKLECRGKVHLFH